MGVKYLVKSQEIAARFHVGAALMGCCKDCCSSPFSVSGVKMGDQDE